jgi:(p)ppGpp synthase/HD superfamily hydrolase
MDDTVLKFAKALDFAARKHAFQRRKGEAQEPYINHVAEVALLLAEATEGEDPNLVLAGLLHDTIEDTKTDPTEIIETFGQDVADLVVEVTDNKSLLKAERKWHQVEHARNKSDRAKMIKIADKISNLKSILHSPPHNWSEKEKREYFDWARKVVDGCRGVNGYLELKFDTTYAKYQR